MPITWCASACNEDDLAGESWYTRFCCLRRDFAYNEWAYNEYFLKCKKIGSELPGQYRHAKRFAVFCIEHIEMFSCRCSCTLIYPYLPQSTCPAGTVNDRVRQIWFRDSRNHQAEPVRTVPKRHGLGVLKEALSVCLSVCFRFKKPACAKRAEIAMTKLKDSMSVDEARSREEPI